MVLVAEATAISEATAMSMVTAWGGSVICDVWAVAAVLVCELQRQQVVAAAVAAAEPVAAVACVVAAEAADVE
jgi:hypothetical protein